MSGPYVEPVSGCPCGVCQATAVALRDRDRAWIARELGDVPYRTTPKVDAVLTREDEWLPRGAPRNDTGD